MMNYYPGQGLAHSTGVLGNSIGLPYPAGSQFDMCKVWGVLLTSQGLPVGRSSKVLTAGPDGTTITDSWDGVAVTAATTTATDFSGRIVGIDRVQAMTNAEGYFELRVLKGLKLSLSCQSFGKTITVDTTALDSVDVSSKF
jgi:hypothetical protein